MDNIGIVATKQTTEDIFHEALQHLLTKEGGYVNDPDDLGGETFAGISRKYYPKWEGWQIIDSLKEDYQTDSIHFKDHLTSNNIYNYVISFYKNNFWDVLQLAKINNKKISMKIFEMSVNLGIPRSVSIVQSCLNIMNNDIYDQIKVDNIIGPLTINLINEVSKKNKTSLLLKLLTIQQGYIYMKLVQNNPTQKVNLEGWINRLAITI